MKKRKENIVILQAIIPDYRIGLFSALKDSLGDRVHIFAGRADFRGTPLTDYHSWDYARRINNLYLCNGRFLWQYGCFFSALRADLLIIGGNMRILSSVLVHACRKLLGRPTVLWGHAEGKTGRFEFLRDIYLKFCDGFISYTEAQRVILTKRCPELRLWTAPNACVSGDDCWSIKVKTDEVDSLLYVGRLIAKKKVSLLVKGFAYARKIGTISAHVRLVIVGDGDEYSKLKSLAQEYGVSNVVEMLGHVSDVKRLRHLYSKAFCAVSPGYVGLSATQAFSFGAPMIVADQESHSPEIEACRPDFNAVFFNSDNEEDLARVINQVWSAREYWLARRATISAWTRNNYSFEAMQDTFLEVVTYFCEPKGSNTKGPE